MTNDFPVRYGHSYKVVLAIVLPALSIVPFIFIMRLFQLENELEEYFFIFSFLGVLILSTIWLVKNIYPKAIVDIQLDQITIHFQNNNIFSPKNFTFKIADIKSFTPRKIAGTDYLVLETQNPNHKFQLSARSYSEEDYLLFNEMMVLINEGMKE